MKHAKKIRRRRRHPYRFLTSLHCSRFFDGAKGQALQNAYEKGHRTADKGYGAQGRREQKVNIHETVAVDRAGALRFNSRRLQKEAL